MLVSKLRFHKSGWRVLNRLARFYRSDVSLPRLPVPPLRQTLERFLGHAKPVVSLEQFQEAKFLALEFGKPGGEGEELQKVLEERAKTEINWLADWWLETYLVSRNRLPIDYSPGLSFPLSQFHSVEEQLSYATRLCVSVLQYKALIDNKQLPLDMSGSMPMDMSQYSLLLGTCRLPKKPRDGLRYGMDNANTRHIIVARNGHLFAVDVLDEAGKPLNSGTILARLHRVLQESGTKNEHPIGLMTSWDRDSWAGAYASLRELGNHSKLEQIETALFVLCLDEAVPVPDSRINEQHRQLLHGGGSAQNSGNRWFDKTLQFCVGRDGFCGLNYEHTPAEAPPVARLMDYVIEHIDQQEITDGTRESLAGTVRRLDFELDEGVKSDIRIAGEHFDKAIEDLELEIFHWDQFGKNLPKTHKISPDSFCQLAFQLAHFKIHGFSPPSYETGTLRTFIQGRTDNIRLPTEESAQFVSAMTQPSCSTQERAGSLRDAAASHKECTAAACSGNGMDRHLLALRLAAQKMGRGEPPLFQQFAYQRLMHFNVSTSQVPSKHDIMTVFGPADLRYSSENDTYGICYNPQENKMIFSVMTWKSCAATDGKRFIATLGESIGEMSRTLTDSIKSKI